MLLFLLGLGFGGFSGGVTNWFTGDGRLALMVGICVTVACWLGFFSVVIFDD